jgi:uncharacterized membrane protein YccC
MTVGVAALFLIGPRRYGYYTCFLTLIALELASVGQRSSWELALVRVALTLAGAAVAIARGFCFDWTGRHRIRWPTAQGDGHRAPSEESGPASSGQS